MSKCDRGGDGEVADVERGDLDVPYSMFRAVEPCLAEHTCSIRRSRLDSLGVHTYCIESFQLCIITAGNRRCQV